MGKREEAAAVVPLNVSLCFVKRILEKKITISADCECVWQLNWTINQIKMTHLGRLVGCQNKLKEVFRDARKTIKLKRITHCHL